MTSIPSAHFGSVFTLKNELVDPRASYIVYETLRPYINAEPGDRIEVKAGPKQPGVPNGYKVFRTNDTNDHVILALLTKLRDQGYDVELEGDPQPLAEYIDTYPTLPARAGLRANFGLPPKEEPAHLSTFG